MSDAGLPPDAVDRIDAEFAGETYYEALRLLEHWGFGARVTRALVWLAAGDLEALHRYARAAERDPEEVVFWAEHEDPDAAEPRRIRSMSDPLPAERSRA